MVDETVNKKKDLALLLERKRDYIGNRVAADTVIAGVSFLLSTLTASYKNIFSISGIVFKYSFCFIGVLYILKIIKDLIRMYTDGYDHARLMKDIEDLDMIQHKHSLIMIKKTINQKEPQFLLYYDEKWDCKLFLNYKTTERNNEQNIVSRIAEGPEAAGNDDFIINDRHYYWMSISDMEKDANIIQKNLEVVDFVKENA